MKPENKNLITKFLFLFVTGWAISLLTENIIITIVICFLFGLALNKTKLGKILLKQNVKQKQPTQVKCDQCGTVQKPDFKFCSSCGARIVKPVNFKTIGNGQVYYPNTILDKLKSLKYDMDEGVVDPQTYYWLFSDIIIIDENKRFWSVGADSLKWYRSQNGEWISDTPSGKLQIVRKSDKFLI